METRVNRFQTVTRGNGNQNGSGKYVNQEQFGLFINHVDQRFEQISDNVNRQLKMQTESTNELSRTQREASRPRYEILVIALAIAGMAGSLGYTYINSASNMHTARDEALEQKIDFVMNGSNRFSREDFRYERNVLDERFDESRDRVETLRVFDREVVQRLATLEERARLTDNELSYRKSWMDRTNERSVRIESQLEERSKNQDRIFENQKLLLQGQADARDKNGEEIQ